MEQLTPELERRLQVEELWARRTVLADSMNALRRERFRAQHSLLTRFGTPAAPPDTKFEHAQTAQADAAPIQNVEASIPPVRRRWLWGPAMAGLVGLFALLGAGAPGLIAQARGRLAVIMVPAVPAAPVHVARAKAGPSPDIRAEVAARIAAALGSQPHSAETLRALQSDPQAFDQTHPAP